MKVEIKFKSMNFSLTGMDTVKLEEFTKVFDCDGFDDINGRLHIFKKIDNRYVIKGIVPLENIHYAIEV